jgi:LPS sulfotransferase NodH
MDSIKSNFVIFAQVRSGSSLLCNTLTKQKNITCHRELFKRHYIHEKIKNFLGDDPKKWVDIKNQNLELFLKLMSEISNKPIYGYKIFSEHFLYFENKNIYLDFLKKNKSKVILLTRDNLLLKYISHMTSKNIKNYTSLAITPKKETVYQLNPINIKYKQYKQYAEKQKKFLEERMSDINLYQLPYIHIKYEDLVGKKYSQCMVQIFGLLNLDFQEFIDLKLPDGTIANHKKINVYSLKDKIINYVEFKKIVENNNDTETLNFLIENNDDINM